MAYKFPCEPVGSPFSPPGTYGFVMLRSSLLQNNINMMERYGVKGIVENLRDLLFRDGKRVDDDTQLPWNLFPDMKNPIRRPDKYFQMITDRSWESILALIRGEDSVIADIVESCLRSGGSGGGASNNKSGNNQYQRVDSEDIIIGVQIPVHARPSGTSRAATLSRLKKDAPELFDRVLNKELSANAAAIEAGFRKKLTPMDIIKFNWKKLSEVERTEFLSWISEV